MQYAYQRPMSYAWCDYSDWNFFEGRLDKALDI